MSRRGRLEEVQGVVRGRRVDHDDVEGPLAVQLEELRDRRHLLRARGGGGELAVDAVGEQLLARVLVGRQLDDELVEGLLHIERHRPQLAARLHVGCVEARGLDARRLARRAHAERARHSPRGVDREHEHPLALAREAEAERGRDRRLADAAGAGADAYPLAFQARAQARAGGRASRIAAPRGGPSGGRPSGRFGGSLARGHRSGS